MYGIIWGTAVGVIKGDTRVQTMAHVFQAQNGLDLTMTCAGRALQVSSAMVFGAGKASLLQTVTRVDIEGKPQQQTSRLQCSLQF